MIRLRDEKINRIAQELPPTEIYGDERGDVLLLGWGSTFGAIRSATQTLQKKGHKVSCAHLRYIYPLPGDLEGILKRFKKVVIPEMNLGQLAMVLRAKYLLDIQSISKVQGQPFKEHEIADRTIEIMEGKPCTPFLTDDFEHELHRLNKTSHR